MKNESAIPIVEHVGQFTRCVEVPGGLLVSMTQTIPVTSEDGKASGSTYWSAPMFVSTEPPQSSRALAPEAEVEVVVERVLERRLERMRAKMLAEAIEQNIQSDPGPLDRLADRARTVVDFFRAIGGR